MAVGVGSSWDRLLVSLARTPSPTSRPGPPSTQVPVPTAGDRALAEARERLERLGNRDSGVHYLRGYIAFIRRKHDTAIAEIEQATALSDDGVVMAVEHRELPVAAIQFHPESIMTIEGKKLLANFLKL
jgi:imidazoleglycerol phosphate synthase glutamine amidotransferase subunit HisH